VIPVRALGLLVAVLLSEACTSSAPRPLADAGSAPAPVVLAARQGPPTHLVVMLHGLGADAASFSRLAPRLAGALPTADFITPPALEPWDQGAPGRQWFSVRGVTDENRPARVRVAGAEVSRWADAELARRGLGKDRLVLVGFSQGAMVAGWLAVHRRPEPAAVVMLSGRVSESESPEAGSVRTPVFVAHGEDDRLISPSVVDPSARSLEAWGARVTTRIYPGLSHGVSVLEVEEAARFIAQAVAKR
jgi:phospholipase/carboxylesterase